MAYGKDAAGQAAVQGSAFRSRTFNQATRALSRNRFPRGDSGGKGGLPYWVDQFQPPISIDCVIRLMDGKFKQEELVEVGNDVQVQEVQSPMVKFVDHFDGAHQRSCICSAGALANYKDKRKECYGCDIYWDTAARNNAGRFESSRMSRQNKYAFAIFDYRPYHHVDQIDRETGKVKTNTKGEPYKNWEPCQGRVCPYCKAGVEMKVGHSTHWPINYTQLQLLRGVERDVGRSCAVCGGIDVVDSLGWMCGSCGECVIEMATTELQPKELIEQTENEIKCPLCGYNGFLDEVYECRSCAARGMPGLRATLFDVDLTVSTMLLEGNKKQMIIKKYSSPHVIAPEFLEAAKPLDLIRRYRPDSLERQAEVFKVEKSGGPTQPYQNPNKPA